MPEERRSHFHGSGRLKSCISVSCFKSRSLRNEVTFMVVLGDCRSSLAGFLQCRQNIHGSSATNPSYCPEGVLPKVKAAGERIQACMRPVPEPMVRGVMPRLGVLCTLSFSSLCSNSSDRSVDLWCCEQLIIIA
jgi:hypothetical protein